jgi:hypothetical protein
MALQDKMYITSAVYYVITTFSPKVHIRLCTKAFTVTDKYESLYIQRQNNGLRAFEN